jgi:hypothetical protein
VVQYGRRVRIRRALGAALFIVLGWWTGWFLIVRPWIELGIFAACLGLAIAMSAAVVSAWLYRRSLGLGLVVGSGMAFLFVLLLSSVPVV